MQKMKETQQIEHNFIVGTFNTHIIIIRFSVWIYLDLFWPKSIIIQVKKYEKDEYLIRKMENIRWKTCKL